MESRLASSTTTTNATDATASNVAMTTGCTIVSAPGKMLMAGGYLVLDPHHIGLVIGVNARFYSSCSMTLLSSPPPPPSSTTNRMVDAATSTNIHPMKIRVISMQFQQEWNYLWDRSSFTLQEVIDDDDDDDDENENDVSQAAEEEGTVDTNHAIKPKKKKNPFLEKALRIALLYIDHPNTDTANHNNNKNNKNKNNTTISSMTIQIVGDNDFYSLVPHLQQRQLQKHQIYELPKCLPIVYQSTGEIYKTGLGSSACLVTAVIGSILYTITTTTTSTSTTNTTTESTSLPQVIERLSQIGHCYAQGKIGSGFDVAAAMYGSHIYQRFDPNILTNLLSLFDDTSTTTTAAMDALYTVVHDNDAWKSNIIEPITCFADDTFLQVMMADVSGGSESPSMAKQVLQWRSKCIQEQELNGIEREAVKVPHWDDLSIINRQIITTLQQIHTMAPTANREVQQFYIDIPCDEWMTQIENSVLTELIVTLKELYVQQRYHMKQMGIVAGNVPIEPDIQTSLCNDVTHHVSGVIATMVPGAGGYDAISILYINHPTVHHNITNYLSQYTQQNVCALTVQGVSYNDGLRIETQFPIETTTIN